MVDPRLLELLSETNSDAFVSADPGLVRMLTGHVSELETGPSAFALAPIVVAGADATILIVADDDGPYGYEGFTIGPLAPGVGALASLRRALDDLGARAMVRDDDSLPLVLAPALEGSRAIPDDVLARLPAIKTSDEITAIRRSLTACDAGQAAARGATRAGATELDLWGAARTAIERLAGGRTPILADLVSGERTAAVGGPPGPRVLARGELILCDLVPRLDGIWGDSCASWAVDEVPAPAETLHRLSREALSAALGALRPGALAGDVDRAARDVIAAAGHDCPHHIGHGVGFHPHEEPRIVPDGQTVLAPGMVVALEPGVYSDGLGVRTEVVAVITAAGHDVLSGHSLELEPRSGRPQSQPDKGKR